MRFRIIDRLPSVRRWFLSDLFSLCRRRCCYHSVPPPSSCLYRTRHSRETTAKAVSLTTVGPRVLLLPDTSRLTCIQPTAALPVTRPPITTPHPHPYFTLHHRHTETSLQQVLIVPWSVPYQTPVCKKRT
ncbi:hypothetical protein PTT_05564 [Pyrenophora teres f. teres 0-1]|uniref:Uncharacterized protein n=1 Tax=Pyrenophora teres f. teres (strain 0-1) TaxID=861557 RepID=E3RF39_PYRTT|nr:hypothetical protein PTT_05564 [Pyrenophora teres f. teres 0-1]